MKQISVQTIANGYDVTIDDENLLFYSVDSLVMGIAHHIGSATVKDIELYRDSLNKGKSPVAYFTDRILQTETELAKVREQRDDKTLINRNLRDELSEVKKENNRLTDKLERLQKKLDKLTKKEK